MENKFKIGDEVICIDREECCWYDIGDHLIISSDGFTEPYGNCTVYNIEGEGKHVWIDESHFELSKAKDNTELWDNRELGCDEEFVKVVPNILKEYTTKHYDNYYQLTEKDIKEGKIRVDAYWVAKQWKIGSRDDSGALFHNLKTIARFGEKNSVEREIKALYNQTKALARVYGVELD